MGKTPLFILIESGKIQFGVQVCKGMGGNREGRNRDLDMSTVLSWASLGPLEVDVCKGMRRE